MQALRRARPSLKIDIGTERVIDWHVLAGVDAVMFQRPTRKVSVQLAQVCAAQGLPIWVEFDDDFFALPEENPHHDEFMTPECHANIRAMLALADVVTVTTPDLAKVFGRFHRDVRIVPNALMTNMVGHVPDHAGKKRTPMVMWRGSRTHQIDIDAYTEPIAEVAKNHPDLTWGFQGYATSRVMRAIGPKAIRGGMLDTIAYFGAIAAARPKVLMVPLADHPFNRSKSNIAGLEATFAGAVPIVPDWPDWQVPGWLHYSDQSTFAAQLELAITMSDEEVDRRWSMAKRHIDNQLTIDTVNAKRNKIVDELEVLAFDRDARAKKRASVSPIRKGDK